MRRLLLVFATTAICLLGVSSGPALAAASATGPACLSAANAAYRHTFDGAAGTATITAQRPLCRNQSQTFSLTSYTAPAPSHPGGLFLYATTHATINPSHRKVTLKVAVPACSTQVYAYFGSQVTTETTTTAPLYDSSRLGVSGSRSIGRFAWFTGGSEACTAAPAVTFTSTCDNGFTARLSNPANANTDAVFARSGTLIRVAPGSTRLLTAKKNATLTLRASNFSTYVGRWRQPSATCPVPIKPTPAVAAPVAATLPPAAALSPTTTAPSPVRLPASAAEDSAPQGPAFWTSPKAAAGTATPPPTGMGMGSVIAIALGLLLIAGGAALLSRVIRSSRGPA